MKIAFVGSFFCRKCVRHIGECKCSKPFVRKQRCASCNRNADGGSLFEEGMLPDLPPIFICEACGGKEVVTGEEWYFVSEPTHTCQTCRHVDAQEALLNCSGIDCAAVAHPWCLHEASPPIYCKHAEATTFLLCNGCSRAGKATCCNLCYADRLSNDSLAAVWEQAEIAVWLKVTVKLATQAAEHGKGLDACLSLVDDRWLSSEKHIPHKLKDSVREVLDDTPSSIKSLHAKRTTLVEEASNR